MKKGAQVLQFVKHADISREPCFLAMKCVIHLSVTSLKDFDRVSKQNHRLDLSQIAFREMSSTQRQYHFQNG